VDPPQGASQPMPESIIPMKAVTSNELPGDDHRWAYEVKWDGYRIIAFLEGGKVRLRTRNLLDATNDFPEVCRLRSRLGAHDVILDGEVVAMDDQGRQSFSALQRRGKERPAVVYMVFDLLYLDDRSTMKLPYLERRRLLDALDIASGAAWQVPGHHVGDGAALLEATRAQGLEGIIAKQFDSTYEPGKRTRSCSPTPAPFAKRRTRGCGTTRTPPRLSGRCDPGGAALSLPADPCLCVKRVEHPVQVGDGELDVEVLALPGP
jgi:bifunctional non-homologous end joining protein LigD